MDNADLRDKRAGAGDDAPGEPESTGDLSGRITALSPAKRALLELRLRKNRPNTAAAQVIPRRGNRDSAPVSFAQQRLWFLDQLEPNSSAYNMPNSLRLKGPLDIDALKQSLNEIVRRHEALRTTFLAVDGEPVQKISSSLTLDLPMRDLTGPSQIERESEARLIATEEAGKPFDLAEGPLVRAMLLRLGDEDHVLILTMHHIVSDGWSIGVLFRELSVLYKAFSNRKPSPLPQLPVQYADYAVWQREWLRGPFLANQLSYWKKQLDNVSTLQLPTDWPRPAVQTYRGARESVVLANDLSAKLKALSRKESVTLFMTLLAAFQILVHRYTAQDDIAVGSPIAGRNRPEIEGLIGFFLNTLVMRTDISGNPTFAELLARVRKMALDAYALQDVPFERLVEELQPQRNLSRTPVFQVFFNMLTLDDRGLELHGLTVERFGHADPHSKFDLTLYVREREQRIGFDLVYNADLFSQPRMVEMLGQFVFLLEQIVESPGLKIAAVSLVTPRAKEALPNPGQPLGSNGFVPVAVRFSEQARRVPNGLAIADNKATWSYNELERRTNQLANYLVATGIQPEDVIAIYAHRNASLVWALLGILKAGGAFVILDPDYPDLRLIDYLRAAKPKGWIEIEGERTVPEVLQEFVKDVPCRVRLKLPSLATAQKDGFLDTYSTDFPGVTVAPDDRAYIAFTSGSTGKPKGILGPHGPLAHFFEWHIRTFELTETDRFSLLAGLSHDPCLRDIFTPLLLGATLFIPDPEKIASGHLADWLNEADISIAHVTPAMGQLLADDATVQCKSLRRIFFGGDTLREALLAKMTQLAPSASFVSFYGATETPQAMGYYLIPETAAVPVNAGQGKKIPLGRGIEDAQLLVLNGTPNLAGIGELGEICIRSPFLSKGYLDDEPMTLDRFVANPFTTTSGDLMYRTGDLGRYLPDGAVEFTGRADRQVKVRGFRIELEELESLLQDYPGVRQSVVVLRDDDSNDKRLVAYIVPERDQSLTVNELRDFLKQRLPGSMVPSSFILLDSFRLTPNGKIDRRALPACDEAGRITRAFVPPRNTTDERLVAIWAKLLGLKQIGIYDDFFELGGHSLLAVRLFAQIEKEFNKRLPLSILFQGATIEHLADLVSQRSPLTNPSSLVAIQPKGSKLPFFCVHELFGDVICYRNLAHHLGQDQPFYALQARGLDGTEEPFDDIEAMAAYYIDTIRTVQPHGPYVLGGLCFGGVVAFEMARQLRGNGESVALVALLDSGIGRGYGKLTWWWRFFQSLHRHIPSWLIGSLQLTRSQWSSLIKLKLTMAKTKLDSAFRSARGDSPQNDIPSRIRDLRDSFGFSERHYRVAQAQYRASRKYHPRLYPGPVALFRARMQPFFSLHSPTKGWDRVAAGGVEIRVIPGNHLGMLQEPHVRVLAKELTACLAKTTKTG